MAALIASQGLFLPSYIFPASSCLHEAIQASYVVFAKESELILQVIAVECSVGSPAAALCQPGKRSRPRTARVVRVINLCGDRQRGRPWPVGARGTFRRLWGDKQPSRLTCSVTTIASGVIHRDEVETPDKFQIELSNRRRPQLRATRSLYASLRYLPTPEGLS